MSVAHVFIFIAYLPCVEKVSIDVDDWACQRLLFSVKGGMYMRRFLVITLSLIMSLCIATTFSFGASGVVIKNYNKIPTLTVGQSYTIYGTVKSNNTIKRVEVGVVNAKTNKWETRYNKNHAMPVRIATCG